MHPIVTPDLVSIRQAELRAEVDRNRLARREAPVAGLIAALRRLVGTPRPSKKLTNDPQSA